MARHEAAVQSIVRTGLAPSYGAVHADLEHKFTNDGRTFLHVKNTNGAARTVTLVVSKTVDGQTVTNPTVTIPADTGDKIIGPFPKGYYNQSDGMVYFNVSAAAGVQFAVCKLPPSQ